MDNAGNLRIHISKFIGNIDYYFIYYLNVDWNKGDGNYVTIQLELTTFNNNGFDIDVYIKGANNKASVLQGIMDKCIINADRDYTFWGGTTETLIDGIPQLIELPTA